MVSLSDTFLVSDCHIYEYLYWISKYNWCLSHLVHNLHICCNWSIHNFTVYFPSSPGLRKSLDQRWGKSQWEGACVQSQGMSPLIYHCSGNKLSLKAIRMSPESQYHDHSGEKLFCLRNPFLLGGFSFSFLNFFSSEFVWSIFRNVEYFFGFLNQTEVWTFFRSH